MKRKNILSPSRYSVSDVVQITHYICGVKIIRQIPNALTLLNLCCGVLGIVVMHDQPVYGAFAILASAIFDVFDGLAARLLKATSKIGKDLDSLADMVSFGVVPMLLAMYYFQALFGESMDETTRTLYGLSFLLIPVCSALRLAKFNNDPGQSVYFSGLPTPAHALFIAGLALHYSFESGWVSSLLFHPAVFTGIFVVSSLLMLAPVQLLSFKVLSTDRLAVRMVSALIIITIILLGVVGFGSVIIILPLYFIFSFINQKLHEVQSRN